MEAKLLSAEANYRHNEMKMPTKSEAGGKVVLMEEAVECKKGIKEAAIVKDVQSCGMEGGGYVMCEIGGEQQPARVKVSGNAGLRTGIARALPQVQSVSRNGPCTCATTNADKRASSSSNQRL